MKTAPTTERGLAKYNAMRDFGTTAEPSGELRPTKGGRSFVIQQHAATAMHYDFRLELDGVLPLVGCAKGTEPRHDRAPARRADRRSPGRLP